MGIVFIGDELTATGFRLTGVETMTPEAKDAASAFAAARARCALLLVTAEVARAIPSDALDAALLADRPIVAIVADVNGRAEPPPLAARAKAILGIET